MHHAQVVLRLMHIVVCATPHAAGLILLGCVGCGQAAPCAPVRMRDLCLPQQAAGLCWVCGV
jgi:hypothetical protein